MSAMKAEVGDRRWLRALALLPPVVADAPDRP
jgi:hypothetical protein